MVSERASDGTRHVPERRPGCYYGRMEDCCTLCAWRLVLAPFVPSLRPGGTGTGEQDGPVGSRVVVPTLGRTDGGETAEHVSGEVTAIHDENGRRDEFAVRSDDGETLAVTVERVD
jgi:hypothetical protein